MTLTNDGTELLGYARQVIERANMLESRYANKEKPQARLAVSTQHYAFSVEAFVNVVEQCEAISSISSSKPPPEIIDDVRSFRSRSGHPVSRCFQPARRLPKAFDDADVSFYPLFDAGVHVFVGENHPLAGRDIIKPEELTVWPRYSFEQGTANSFYYSEEPLSYVEHSRNIRISDRGTLSNLLTSYNGYTLSTGVLSSEMHTGIVSIPLDTDERMTVGYIMHNERKPSELLDRYIEELHRIIGESEGVTAR